MAGHPIRPGQHVDLEEHELQQGPFKQRYNPDSGNWEMYVTVNGQDILFAVFETDDNGNFTAFRIQGTFEEGQSL